MAQKDLVIPIKDGKYDSLIEAVAFNEGYPDTIIEVVDNERKRVPNPQTKEQFVVEKIKEIVNKKYISGSRQLASKIAGDQVAAQLEQEGI